jgi:phosphoglucomutase
MVTASHNPKVDNGFKVYWDNGSQIIPPHDSGIASSIQANLQPWTVYDCDGVPGHSLATDVTAIIAEAYYSALAKLASPHPQAMNSRKIAYTGKVLFLFAEYFEFSDTIASAGV